MKTRLILSLSLIFSVGFFDQSEASKISEDKTIGNYKMEKDIALSVNISGKLNLCSIDEKGYVFLDIKGGNPPYTISWQNQVAEPYLYDLGPGSYTVVIKDNAGNQLTEKFMIQPPIPVKVGVNQIYHANVEEGVYGSASLKVATLVNRTVKIEWCNGLEDTLEAKNLAPGTYTVKILDEFGCDSTIAFEIRDQTNSGLIPVNQKSIGPITSSDAKGLDKLNKDQINRNYSKKELMKIAEEIQNNRALAEKK